MIEAIESLVDSYEKGAVTRRQLLIALASIAAPAAADAQAPDAPATKARLLHHVNVQVANVARSEAFYRRLFALPASRIVQGPDNHGLDLPGGGLIILQRSDTPGRIDHFCVGVENWNADRLRASASAAGVDRVIGSAADNFFVADPDGLRVQLSAVDWSA